MRLDSIQAAAKVLQQGQVLAYPTEAVWGLGCDPHQPAAFEQILQLKQRPIEKGVILLAADVHQVQPMLDLLSSEMREQVIHSWTDRQETDRATTWLLPVHDSIPTWITGQHDTVAFRVTTHPLCVALCHAFGGYIVSTSANPAGEAPARTLEQVEDYFGHELACLEGQLGLSQAPSRIIDARTGLVIRA